MALTPPFDRLRLPVIGSPMFVISGPELVKAQCRAGIIGSFPALNAREADGEPIALGQWLDEIKEALAAHDAAHPDAPAAPFAVNQIVHRSNSRLERDVQICVDHRVPIWITSLGAQPWLNDAAHSIGATVLHDVTNNTHARKAIEKGADGLIAVAAGAGGHAGRQSPFALIREIREWFDGPLFLSGAITNGRSIAAARALGADGAYIGSAFIAASEANADEQYKDMVVNSGAEDIVYTDLFTGIPANYLRGSITAQGLDPDDLPAREAAPSIGSKTKAWRDIWGAGQGVGAIRAVQPAREIIDNLGREYRKTLSDLAN